MVEALTQALAKYPGTVAVVSHDRSFIRRVGRKIIEINHGEVTLYPGSYDDYVWSLESGILSERGDPQRPSSKMETENFTASSESEEKFNYKDTKKNLDKELKKCERTLTETDEALTKLNGRILFLNQAITESQNDNQGPKQTEIIAEIVEVQTKISSLEAQWFAAIQRKEELETSLKNLTER
jgi:ATP-binding cassette, subfamily F, member 3